MVLNVQDQNLYGYIFIYVISLYCELYVFVLDLYSKMSCGTIVTLVPHKATIVNDIFSHVPLIEEVIKLVYMSIKDNSCKIY